MVRPASATSVKRGKWWASMSDPQLAQTPNPGDLHMTKMTSRDSPRWCETCQAWGDHHTDRHPVEVTKVRADEIRVGDVIRWPAWTDNPWHAVEKIVPSKSGKTVGLAAPSHPWQLWREARIATLIEVQR